MTLKYSRNRILAGVALDTAVLRFTFTADFIAQNCEQELHLHAALSFFSSSTNKASP